MSDHHHHDEMKPAVVGSVGYLNARPLTDGLDPEHVTLVTDHPAAIAAKLIAGEVDIALVPVAAVLAEGDWRVVPGVCIGADGAVDSVLLVSETPPEEWTELVLDGESRTSAMLTRLLAGSGALGTTLGQDQIRQVAPGTAMDEASGSTAALVIGDAARTVPDRFVHRVDLAVAWKAWTGLPFVFAVWAGRPDLDPLLVAHLRQVGRSGAAAVAQNWSGEDAVYLGERIRYDLDDRALMGLRRFGALAKKAGLIPREDLELYGPTHRQRPRPSRVDALLLHAVDGGMLNEAEALRLEVGADLADLASAAGLKRNALHDRDTVGYALGLRSSDEQQIAAAIAAGASEIELEDDARAADLARMSHRWPGVRFVVPASVEAGSFADWAAAGAWGVTADPAGIGVDALRASAGALPWAQEVARMEAAAAAGLAVTGALCIGQGESGADRVDHLLALRAVDQRIGLHTVRVQAVTRGGESWASKPNTAVDHLRASALTRLVLDVPSLQGSPGNEGVGMTAASLRMGIDHFGTWFLGSDDHAAEQDEVTHQISALGYTPKREAGYVPTTPSHSGKGSAHP